MCWSSIYAEAIHWQVSLVPKRRDMQGETIVEPCCQEVDLHSCVTSVVERLVLKMFIGGYRIVSGKPVHYDNEST